MRLSNRTYSKIFILIFILFFASGFTGLFGRGPLRAVRPEPFLDRAGRLTMVHLTGPYAGGTLAAVVVNFEGQNLRAESGNMNIKKPFQGKLRELINDANELFNFTLFEVKNQNGKLLGYLFARERRLVGQYLENETLVLSGVEPQIP